MPIIVWLRQDLRLGDHPAFTAAVATQRPVLPVYVLDDAAPGRWKMGGASRWWLHESLTALGADLARAGVPLILRQGPSAAALLAIAAESGSDALFFNRCIEPFWSALEAAVTLQARAAGLDVRAFDDGGLLFPPGTVRSRDGGTLKVFTPFWKACLAAPAPALPLPVPHLRPASISVAGDELVAWKLPPHRPDWAGGLREAWRVGETAAHARLDAFLDGGLAGYAADRNRPEPSATSALSPHLHVGEITSRQVWHRVSARMEADPSARAGGESYLREIGWREFCASILMLAPNLPDAPFQPRFEAFPWRDDKAALGAWQRGETGYPIVDAGMRQLWATGWMHNRVRMIAASFLVKHLLIPWQAGEAWFWDTLVDADLANNAGGWQWVAGCGTDAAPYFRIFNPVLQGERFDAAGAYVHRWLPELARLPAPWCHRPWEAAPLALAGAGVRLGATYPVPIVDHAAARRRALAAFESLGRR